MIHVIAHIKFVDGQAGELREIYREFVPRFRAEPGCLAYQPTCDFDASLPNQILDDLGFTVIEQWESLEAFQGHLTAAHTQEFRERIQGVVSSVKVQVLEAVV